MFRSVLFAAFAALISYAQMGHAAGGNLETRVAQPPQGGVDIALVLAVDVSSSVDAEERLFQRMAYARALSDPLVIRAALGGRHGRIALGFMEWSGPRFQNLALPVRVIDTADGMMDFAAGIEAIARAEQVSGSEGFSYFSGTTAMGNALMRAADALRALDVPATSVVIDLSADGINNDGELIDEVRDELVAEGFVINGLPIAVGASIIDGRPGAAALRLESFFTHCVIGGRGAFQVMAQGWKDVEQALRAKLILELAGFDAEHRRRMAQALRHRGFAMERVLPAQFQIDLGQATKPVTEKVHCASGRFRPPPSSTQ